MHKLPGPLLALGILVLDQATKWLVLTSLDPYQAVLVTPFFKYARMSASKVEWLCR